MHRKDKLTVSGSLGLVFVFSGADAQDDQRES